MRLVSLFAYRGSCFAMLWCKQNNSWSPRGATTNLLFTLQQKLDMTKTYKVCVVIEFVQLCIYKVGCGIWMHCVSMGLLLRGGFHWVFDGVLSFYRICHWNLHIIHDKTEFAVPPHGRKILITFYLIDQFKQMIQKNNHNKKCSFLM